MVQIGLSFQSPKNTSFLFQNNAGMVKKLGANTGRFTCLWIYYVNQLFERPHGDVIIMIGLIGWILRIGTK